MEPLARVVRNEFLDHVAQVRSLVVNDSADCSNSTAESLPKLCDGILAPEAVRESTSGSRGSRGSLSTSPRPSSPNPCSEGFTTTPGEPRDHCICWRMSLVASTGGRVPFSHCALATQG